MRDEKEERKKQARSNKQTRQSNTAPMYMQCGLQCYSVLRMCEPDGMPTFNNEKLGNYRLPVIVYTESLLV